MKIGKAVEDFDGITIEVKNGNRSLTFSARTLAWVVFEEIKGSTRLIFSTKKEDEAVKVLLYG